MIERLEVIENRFEELNMRLADPGIMNNQEQYLKLMKEHTELSDIVEKYREYKAFDKALKDARLMLEDKPDKELEEMIELEIEGDTYFPHFNEDEFELIREESFEGEIPYQYLTYVRNCNLSSIMN